MLVFDKASRNVIGSHKGNYNPRLVETSGPLWSTVVGSGLWIVNLKSCLRPTVKAFRR